MRCCITVSRGRRSCSALRLLHLPQRCHLALHAGALITLEPGRSALSAELLFRDQFVAALAADETICRNRASSGCICLLGVQFLGDRTSHERGEVRLELLQSLQHHGALGGQRLLPGKFVISRERLSHQAGHELAAVNVLLGECTGIGKVKFQSSGGFAVVINRNRDQ